MLQDNQVDYLLRDIIEDTNARLYLRDVLRSGGVPTTVIGDQVIIGFQPEALKHALGLK